MLNSLEFENIAIAHQDFSNSLEEKIRNELKTKKKTYRENNIKVSLF